MTTPTPRSVLSLSSLTVPLSTLLVAVGLTASAVWWVHAQDFVTAATLEAESRAIRSELSEARGAMTATSAKLQAVSESLSELRGRLSLLSPSR